MGDEPLAIGSYCIDHGFMIGIPDALKIGTPRSLRMAIAVKSAGCPAFLPVGRGGEGGNGLPQWSQSRPCNYIYISRKPRPVPACAKPRLQKPCGGQALRRRQGRGASLFFLLRPEKFFHRSHGVHQSLGPFDGTAKHLVSNHLDR
jgi:hypothetical protein